MTSKSKNSFECKYCKKSFKKESTILVHMCEPKRRWLQEKEKGPQIGMMAYLRFYELTQSNNGKKKTYADFAKSHYYKAFVRFGWHCVELRVINLNGLIDFLIKEGVRLDWWAKDRYYEKYLIGMVKGEHPQDALTRSVNEIQLWIGETDQKFDKFFVDVSPNRLTTMLVNGRLSPWIVYNCTTGIAALDNLDASQISTIYGFIDPEFWTDKFQKHNEDVIWVKQVLEKAGFDA